jgi:ERCC4-related helicase
MLIKSNIEMDTRSFNKLKFQIDELARKFNVEKDMKSCGVISFMKNLINSLEILDILGISRSVEFIDSCIEKEQKSNLKSNNWTESEMIMIITFQKTLSKFYGTSEKLDFLCEFLNDKSNFDSNSKIIIFVRARKTARFICEYLRQDKRIEEEWNPTIFVGQANGRIDGMGWYDEQEPALEKFRENDCRLFVATNVLQVIHLKTSIYRLNLKKFEEEILLKIRL